MTHELAILDETGDTKIIWDPANRDEVDNAKETFDKFRKKGYSIFSVKKNGDTDKRMDKFDPEIAMMIAVPPIVGG